MKNLKCGHDHPIVCLDAGHYGKYNRSPVVPEFYESDMNWKLHLMLKAELEQYGMEVRLTRIEQDKDLAVASRGRLSDGCDLFLSIHANWADRETTDHPLIITQLDGQGDALGSALAQIIAQTMGTSQPGQIWQRKGSSGGEYYGVLRGAAEVGTMGMILEHSFYTNTKAAKWLLDEGNLQKLAQAEAKLIAQWFGTEGEIVIGVPYALELVSIRRGSRGERVEAVQTLLMAKGYHCGSTGADGKFGSNTEKAVRAYQTDMEMQVDGIVGPETMSGLLGYR